MIDLLKNLTNNLGYVVIIAFFVSNLSIFKKIIQKDEFGRSELLTLSFVFGAFGIIGTYIGTDVHGAIANTRLIGIMTGGILCGPFVGIISGIIAGVHRLSIDIGGITSLPCALTTIFSGFVSAFIFKRAKREYKWLYGLVGGIIMQSFEMGLILLLSKPFSQALSIVQSIYLPMGLTNAIGIAILIILIQNIFREKEEIASKQAKLALEIANKTLPYFRDITPDSLEKICDIIRESTGAAAVAITDKTHIWAHIGLGDDHHINGEKFLTSATERVLQTGEILTLTKADEINCPSTECPLKSAIIAPLKEGDEIIGTLKIYYAKENGISFSHKNLAIGLSQLISTQLEISKLGRLKELTAKAEMKALQAQINPHFMFNALNTIVSFLRYNPDKARKLIINLSTYLRHNIDEAGSLVDISKELEQVKAYVDIEKARFGDKLNVVYNIDETIAVRIPSLIIQPLVENSIKHGILKGTGSGTVKIDVKKLNSSDVQVSVEDDGIGIHDSIIQSVNDGTMKENKIGISNVNSRLKYTYRSGLTIERLARGTRTSFVINDIGA